MNPFYQAQLRGFKENLRVSGQWMEFGISESVPSPPLNVINMQYFKAKVIWSDDIERKIRADMGFYIVDVTVTILESDLPRRPQATELIECPRGVRREIAKVIGDPGSGIVELLLLTRRPR